MKPIGVFVLFCSILALPAFGLKPGDSIGVEAIAKAEFLKGEAPTSWEPGKLYIIECWATWCGPCVAAIPHMDQLYDTYHEKGLEVFGMDVMENEKEKVVKFVEGKGDGMSYPVAYVGNEGPFDKQWLKAAGVNGIPHAFVLKDGVLLFSEHPARIDAQTIEGLLAGGEREEKIIADIRREEAVDTLGNIAYQAMSKGDAPALESALDSINKLGSSDPRVDGMRVVLAAIKKQWSSSETLMADLKDPRVAGWSAEQIARLNDESADEPPVEFLRVIAVTLGATKNLSADRNAALARVQWKLGDKAAAMTAAKAAAESAQYGKPAYQAFAASVEKGAPQTLKALNNALSAE